MKISKQLKSLLIGFFLVLSFCLAFSASPATAFAATKKTPVTVLKTTPTRAHGQNDWYTSVTMVHLNSNQTEKSAKTYYQWNTTSGKWQTYDKPFRAWQGDNVLYYYTVTSHGVTEKIHKVEIKVDYVKPQVQNLKSVSASATANISWLNGSDTIKNKVYKLDDRKYRLIGETSASSFTDKKVKVNATYVYGLVAIDQAGLKSKMKTTSVKITAAPAIQTTVVTPRIGKGASIVTNLQKKQVETVTKTENSSPTNVEAKSKDEAKANAPKNWNHLLLALSILIIAISAAIAAYYIYEWWAKRSGQGDSKTVMKNRETEDKTKKTGSRW